MGGIVSPNAIGIHFDQPLQTDLSHARRHATGFQGDAVGTQGFILAFDERETADALFARPGCAAVHGLLVRAALDALAITPATLLVDQDNAILGPLVNRLPGTRTQAAGVGAM